MESGGICQLNFTYKPLFFIYNINAVVCMSYTASYLFFVHNETTARIKRQYIISKDDLKKSFNLKARE